jgi:tetratricopeptide (TPR) repeat protein
MVVILAAGCGTPKVTTSYRTIAEQAVAEGNFEAATENWRLFFEQQSLEKKEIEPENYAQAGKMAFRANQPELALDWFQQAEYGNYGDAAMYTDLAEIYRQQGNLQKELEALEFYHRNYQNETDLEGANTRLFQIYTEVKNEEKAMSLWPRMKLEDRQEEDNLAKYFTIQRQLKNESVSDSIAEALLEVNPKNVPALEWLGIKYYNQAEERYQREMKKYENNRNRVQHIKLTQELKTVTADFQKALEYFKPLWEIDQNASYAAYLVNIYNRFEDPATANYYRKYLE